VELTIPKIEGNTATYSGCRQVFQINVPLFAASACVPEFKIGDQVAHSNPGQNSAAVRHGRIIKFHEIEKRKRSLQRLVAREPTQRPVLYGAFRDIFGLK